MGQSAIWNFITWLYISVFCEFIFRKIVKTIRNRKSKQTSDNETDSTASEDEKIDQKLEKSCLETSAPKVKSPRGKKKPTIKFNKEALNRDIGVDKTSMFGGRAILSDIHAAAEESLIEDSFKKVTSYYDKSGNLLYQKERDVVTSPPAEPINPSFRIKPQPSMAKMNSYSNSEENIQSNLKGFLDDGRKEYLESKVKFEEDIDKTFNDIFNTLPHL